MIRRVLLVDDDIAEIAAVKRALLRAGAQARLATGAADAGASLAASRPDLVIVSAACGGGEGAEIARRLAEGVATRDLPLLLLGDAPEGLAVRSLARPVDAALLADEVRAVLERPRPAPPPPAPSLPTPAAFPVPVQLAREVPAPVPTPTPYARAAAEPPPEAVGTPRLPPPSSATPTPTSTPTATAAAAMASAEAEARRRAALARVRKVAETPAAPPAPAPEPAAPARPAPPPRVAPAPAEPHRPPAPADPPVALLSGSFERTSAPRLLALAARAALSGRLDFSGSAPRSLYLEEGRLVGATSGAPGERVEEVALRFGLITREQHRRAAQLCAGLPSRRAAVALLEAGFLKPEELTGLVRRRAEQVLFALFGEPGATWRHAGAAVPPEERVAPDRPLLALAVEGVRLRWQADELARVLGGEATLLGPATAPPPVAELALEAAEERLRQGADGLRALEELVSESPLDPHSTRQLLAALVEVGALEVRVRAEPGGAAAPGAIDAARLAEKLEQVRRADYCTILGLPRTATPHEIRRSTGRLLAEFDPARWGGEPGTELGSRLDEVRRVVREAGEVLADDELRAAYLAGLE